MGVKRRVSATVKRPIGRVPTHKERAAVSSSFPVPGQKKRGGLKVPTKKQSFRCPQDLWDELVEAAQYETDLWKQAGRGHKFSASEMLIGFARDGLEAYWAAREAVPNLPDPPTRERFKRNRR